ncbi:MULTISPECIES: helix-turn-helix transcriptional regulator [unclassified Rhodococcus (in: high G+C Gram-positive bacteria)]|uniref:PadR family transcriptional regulator n=1 Tax=Rhodococcus sp. SJ-3 TaxID=3454628 RepID=UPI002DA04EE2|nr:helix-turn-helix transcriptional regulator [Rhodococcus sp. (in: high G+C Gram-positive bacteria)]
MIDPEISTGHSQEVRRGSVVVASLLMLRTPGYGYGLLEALAAAGVAVDANTLYPLLRRLEKQGLLVSEWNTDEARPRKFYRTSEAGGRLAGVLLDEWTALGRSLRTIDSHTEGDAR